MSRNSNEEKLPPSCRVFVGNIDTTCSKREVQDLFEPFGKVVCSFFTLSFFRFSEKKLTIFSYSTITLV